MSATFSIPAEKANSKKQEDRQRWALVRRSSGTWEVTIPGEASYVPEDIATNLLAHQLALLTADAATPAQGAEEKRELARLLNAILEK